ncbi:MAG: tRNA (cytidine(56)-2'-O)-methyltransferase [Candidatus Aenigmarchaeota archaeon]|nr:tRNA (cytidine(56)-2'-O)-methyltransferase [Candidatus Aenigmarchaeota archaeon]
MIIILRIGHRYERDERLSTHCGLVARAFGARRIIFSGEHDAKLMESIGGVAERWGGPFDVHYEGQWKKSLLAHKKKGFTVVHLTMYGTPVQKAMRIIRKRKKLLVVVGSEKVPPEIYQLADFNVSVTSQPHSEVAALAVFLHEYHKGKELSKRFRGAKLRIVPQEKGKKVIETRSRKRA